jgi:phosphoglycerol transferase MdoB-like AlkP superfamily enzyme
MIFSQTKYLLNSFPPSKVIIWGILFFVGLAFFAIFRLFFLIAHLGMLNGAGPLLILESFWIGLRFDTAVINSFYLPLFVISILPFINFASSKIQSIAALMLTVIFAFFFLVLSADIRFFDVYGSRMNFWAIEFMADPVSYLYSIITYPGSWILFILWISLTIVFFFAIKKFLRFMAQYNQSTPLTGKLVGYLLSLALLIIGARGGLGMKPLDWGAALFSNNYFINQMALNGVYTLSHSIYEEYKEGRTISRKEDDRFSFYDNQTAYKTVADMLNLPPSETNSDYTIEKQSSGQNQFDFLPNIVIVIMESWAADRIGALGSKLNISPEFDTLCNHGILFPQFYANAVRTNHGIPAILCSFPYVSGRSIMRRYSADHPFRSLAAILKENNYGTTFAYGGDIEFDNIEGFLRTAGYDKFYGEGDFDTSKKLGKWGIPDHVIFDQLAHEISSLKRPFHLAVLTLSNHDPYLIPDEQFHLYDNTTPDFEKYNTFYYSDWAIGQFMDSLRKEPVFDSTIFVFTADHCPYQTGAFPLMPKNFRIPFLIYAPHLIGDSSIIIQATGAQVDISPTLVGLLGLTTTEYAWGRNLLKSPNDDSGFAVIVSDEKLGIISGASFFFEWLDGRGKALYDLNQPEYFKSNLIDSNPDIADKMEKQLRSYIQLANYLSRGGRKY